MLIKKILIILAILTAFWIGGLMLFFKHIPQHIADTQTRVQAIVVLTGGRDRLKTGFQLLCAGRADLIFISGVHPAESLKSVLKTVETSEAVCNQGTDWLATHTYLGHNAANTLENALETAEWLKRKKITSICLVTAAYHMPRSLLEFKNLLPDVTIIPHPVLPNRLNRSGWWRDDEVLRFLFSEYHKFLWAFVRMKVS